MTKPKILYLENYESTREIYEDIIEEEFPEHELVSAPSVREGLNKIYEKKLSGSLKTKKEIISSLKSFNQEELNSIDLLITDGLLDNEKCNGEDELHGWDLIDILRKTGYRGKIIYVGNAELPNWFNESDLNVEIYNKINSHDGLVDIMNDYIKEKQ